MPIQLLDRTEPIIKKVGVKHKKLHATGFLKEDSKALKAEDGPLQGGESALKDNGFCPSLRGKVLVRIFNSSVGGTGESVEAPARDSGNTGKHAKVIDNHDAAVYIQTHCL